MRYSPKFLAWLKEQSKKVRRFGSVCTAHSSLPMPVSSTGATPPRTGIGAANWHAHIHGSRLIPIQSTCGTKNFTPLRG